MSEDAEALLLLLATFTESRPMGGTATRSTLRKNRCIYIRQVSLRVQKVFFANIPKSRCSLITN